MRIIVASIVGMLVGAAALYTVGFRLPANSPGSEPTIDVPQADRVVALGRIVPRGGMLSIPIPPTVTVQSLTVEEGADVKKGDILATLDSQSLLQREVDLAEALLEEAQNKWSLEFALASAEVAKTELLIQQIEDGAEVEDKAMDDKAAALELSVQQQQKDLDRLMSLSRDVVSEQQLEHQRLLLKKAKSEHQAALTANALARQQREFRMATASETLRTAKQNLEHVKSSNEFRPLKVRLMQARERLAETTIVAPVSGRVLRIYVRPGEAGGNKPLLQMASLDELEVVAEVFQTDVPRVAIGGIAKIRSDAWGGEELTGKVMERDRMVSIPELRSLDPLAPADRHVIRIPVRLDSESAAEAAKWLQMQVDVILPVQS